MGTPGQRKGGDHFNVMEPAVGLAMDGLGDIGGSAFKIVDDFAYSTRVSLVSAHGRLNIISTFGPHGHLPRIKIPYAIEAATEAATEVP